MNKAQFLRDWGLPEKFQWRSLRYKNPPEKGVYWYYFSLWVRQRDVERYGTCISCGKVIEVETCDAGHFIPASSCGRDLLFDPVNVNAECKRCNAFDSGHLFGYEEGLNHRYGSHTPDVLKRKYKMYKEGPVVKDWKKSEYAEKIKELPTYKG